MKDFIAIFDSGIGGLTVYNTIKKIFPHENIVYLADTANCPYGVKTLQQINAISNKNINYLKSMGAKVIVIACNTATSSVKEEIINSNGYIIGVIEPTAKAAYNASISKRIGVFATNLTVSTKAYDEYLEDAYVCSEGCSDFVLPIENGELHSDNMKSLIKAHASTMDNIDTLILGCTHFPYIKDEIQLMMPSVKLIESGVATSEVVKKYLDANNLNSFNDKRALIFLTTGNVIEVSQQLERLNQVFDDIKEVRID